MAFPLDFDFFTLWLAVTSVILLVTSELLSPNYGQIHARINRKKLRNVAIVMSLLFLATVAVRIVGLLA